MPVYLRSHLAALALLVAVLHAPFPAAADSSHEEASWKQQLFENYGVTCPCTAILYDQGRRDGGVAYITVLGARGHAIDVKIIFPKVLRLALTKAERDSFWALPPPIVAGRSPDGPMEMLQSGSLAESIVLQLLRESGEQTLGEDRLEALREELDNAEDFDARKSIRGELTDVEWYSLQAYLAAERVESKQKTFREKYGSADPDK